MGLFLMETLRITHLFPRIHGLSDTVRRRLMFAAATLLITLAGIEAALALMRDMLIADKAALLQSLSAVQQHAPADGWMTKIPTAGQMLLGFILPFALAFVAVPLESFIASARTVLGSALVALTQGAALGMRLLATLVKSLTKLLITFYDIVIVLPLLVERLIKRGPKAAAFDVDDETLVPRRH
jgi:hypothetical protein